MIKYVITAFKYNLEAGHHDVYSFTELKQACKQMITDELYNREVDFRSVRSMILFLFNDYPHIVCTKETR
jgi:hypothetical protein